MVYTQALRENYSLEQHEKIIDISFWHLDITKVQKEIKTLFEESGIAPYVQWGDALHQKILTGYQLSDTEMDKLQREYGFFNIEMVKLLQHLINDKRPLSYKHIAYDELKVGDSIKFVIFTDFFGQLGQNDIILLTGTGKTEHKDHLRRLVTESIQEHWRQDIGNLLSSDASISMNHLWGGRVKKLSEKSIHAYSTSLWLGGTTNTTAKTIFTHLFPDLEISTDMQI